MIQYTKYCVAIIVMLAIGSCKKKQYSMGSIDAPTGITITTTLAGQDASNPNGDGSGNVNVTVSGKNALSYYIDYGDGNSVNPKVMPSSQVTHKYTKLGLNTYRITVVAYGPGGSTTTVTKDIQVQSNFTPDATIVTNLTGNSSKTWGVDKDIPAHFGVGPWSPSSVKPEWWSAAVNEKVSCCNCFYTARFTFTQVSPGNYTLTVNTPDGAFTKTGALAGGLPGIPSSGAEACYSYGGGSSSFSFIPSTSGIPASAPSTKTAILLSGNNTFIGYGAVLKEYEILSITQNSLYLRVQGTETGNAWYIKLKVI